MIFFKRSLSSSLISFGFGRPAGLRKIDGAKKGSIKRNSSIGGAWGPLSSLSNHKTKFFNQTFDKSRLKNFVLWFYLKYGEHKTVHLVDELKTIGFQYATKAGISLGIEDLKIPPKKAFLMMEAENLSISTMQQFKRGEITEVERFQRLIDTWHRTSELLKIEVIENFEETDVLNPVYMMAFSGARGNISQVRQLVGMRGLMSNPQGQIIDYPIRSNFREGLTLTEYIISSYGARKGIVDTALRTANAGYLTRRLVDVAQHVIISNSDCKTNRGIFLTDMKEGPKTIYSLQNRLIGRVLARNISIENNGLQIKLSVNMEKGDRIKIASRNVEISNELATTIALHSKRVFVRSPLTCQTNKLVCQLCYGWSLAQGNLVSIGEAVGVVAAQSIGEPGTQLTMRTFHTGGVFSGNVSDQIKAPFNGIVFYKNPIVGKLIRTPEGKIAFLTKNEGSFLVYRPSSLTLNKTKFRILQEDFLLGKGETKNYKIPFYTLLFLRQGEKVLNKQVIAQISSINRQKIATDQAEVTIKAELSGIFFSKNLEIEENKVGPLLKNQESVVPQEIITDPLSFGGDSNNSLLDTINRAWNWGYAWILSGKIYELPLASNIFPIFGDYINKKSYINSLDWNISSSFGSSFQLTIPLKGTPFNNPLIKSLRSSAKNYGCYQFFKKNLNGNKKIDSQGPYLSDTPSLFTFKNSAPPYNNKINKDNVLNKKDLKVLKNDLISFELSKIVYKKIGYFLKLNQPISSFSYSFHNFANFFDERSKNPIKSYFYPSILSFNDSLFLFSSLLSDNKDLKAFWSKKKIGQNLQGGDAGLHKNLKKQNSINSPNWKPSFNVFLNWFPKRLTTQTGGLLFFEPFSIKQKNQGLAPPILERSLVSWGLSSSSNKKSDQTLFTHNSKEFPNKKLTEINKGSLALIFGPYKKQILKNKETQFSRAPIKTGFKNYIKHKKITNLTIKLDHSAEPGRDVNTLLPKSSKFNRIFVNLAKPGVLRNCFLCKPKNFLPAYYFSFLNKNSLIKNLLSFQKKTSTTVAHTKSPIQLQESLGSNRALYLKKNLAGKILKSLVFEQSLLNKFGPSFLNDKVERNKEYPLGLLWKNRFQFSSINKKTMLRIFWVNQPFFKVLKKKKPFFPNSQIIKLDHDKGSTISPFFSISYPKEKGLSIENKKNIDLTYSTRLPFFTLLNRQGHIKTIDGFNNVHTLEGQKTFLSVDPNILLSITKKIKGGVIQPEIKNFKNRLFNVNNADLVKRLKRRNNVLNTLFGAFSSKLNKNLAKSRGRRSTLPLKKMVDLTKSNLLQLKTFTKMTSSPYFNKKRSRRKNRLTKKREMLKTKDHDKKGSLFNFYFHSLLNKKQFLSLSDYSSQTKMLQKLDRSSDSFYFGRSLKESIKSSANNFRFVVSNSMKKEKFTEICSPYLEDQFDSNSFSFYNNKSKTMRFLVSHFISSATNSILKKQSQTWSKSFIYIKRTNQFKKELKKRNYLKEYWLKKNLKYNPFLKYSFLKKGFLLSTSSPNFLQKESTENKNTLAAPFLENQKQNLQVFLKRGWFFYTEDLSNLILKNSNKKLIYPGKKIDSNLAFDRNSIYIEILPLNKNSIRFSHLSLSLKNELTNFNFCNLSGFEKKLVSPNIKSLSFNFSKDSEERTLNFLKALRNKNCRFKPEIITSMTENIVTPIFKKESTNEINRLEYDSAPEKTNPLFTKNKERKYLVLIRKADEFKFLKEIDSKKEIFQISNQKSKTIGPAFYNLNKAIEEITFLNKEVLSSKYKRTDLILKEVLFNESSKFNIFKDILKNQIKTNSFSLKTKTWWKDPTYSKKRDKSEQLLGVFKIKTKASFFKNAVNNLAAKFINKAYNSIYLYSYYKNCFFNKQKRTFQIISKYPSSTLKWISSNTFYESILPLNKKYNKSFSRADSILNKHGDGSNNRLYFFKKPFQLNPITTLKSVNLSPFILSYKSPYSLDYPFKTQMCFFTPDYKPEFNFNRKVLPFQSTKRNLIYNSIKPGEDFANKKLLAANSIWGASPIKYEPVYFKKVVSNYLMKRSEFYNKNSKTALLKSHKFNIEANINFISHKPKVLRLIPVIIGQKISSSTKMVSLYLQSKRVGKIISNLAYFFSSPIVEYSLVKKFARSINLSNMDLATTQFSENQFPTWNLNNVDKKRFLFGINGPILGFQQAFEHNQNKETLLYKTEFVSFQNNAVNSQLPFIKTYSYSSFEGEVISNFNRTNLKPILCNSFYNSRKGAEKKRENMVFNKKRVEILSEQQKFPPKKKNKKRLEKGSREEQNIKNELWYDIQANQKTRKKLSQYSPSVMGDSVLSLGRSIKKKLTDSFIDANCSTSRDQTCIILTKADQIAFSLPSLSGPSLGQSSLSKSIGRTVDNYKEIYFSIQNQKESLKNKNQYLINDIVVDVLNFIVGAETVSPQIINTDLQSELLSSSEGIGGQKINGIQNDVSLNGEAAPDIIKAETLNLTENFKDIVHLKQNSMVDCVLEIKKIPAGLALQTSKLLLGEFLVYGDRISLNLAITKGGQIIHINNKKITLRHGQPIFISPKAILHKYDGDFIEEQSSVITLSYQQLKTGDIVQGIPKIEQFFEARTTKRGRLFRDSLENLLKALFNRYHSKLSPEQAVRQSFYKIQQIIIDGVQRVYRSQGVTIADKHLEVIVKQMTSKVRITFGGTTGYLPGEICDLYDIELLNKEVRPKITYEPIVLGITKSSLEVKSFLSAASFQQTTRVLTKAALSRKKDYLNGLKENVILGNLIPAGTGYLVYLDKII